MSNDLLATISVTNCVVSTQSYRRGCDCATLDLSAFGNVSPSYLHHDRLLNAREPLILPDALLKWYELRRVQDAIPAALITDAEHLVADEIASGRIELDYGLGFVVLHFSPPMTYLIVGGWRANQELWEALYTRDLESGGCFQRVDPGANAPTLCVWELAPVWHERQSWRRYLYSARDHDAKLAWLTDVISGTV